MKKLLLLFVALLTIAVIASPSMPSYAGKAKHAPAGTKYHGKVQSINATDTQITIGSKKDGDHTFTITGTTKIKIDGAKADASAIQTGAHAQIWSVDGTNATAIRIGKKKDAAANNPAL